MVKSLQKPPAITGPYYTTVNYDRTLEQMIEAAHQDNVDPDFTSGIFPISGKGQVYVELFVVHFDRRISGDEVLKKLDRMGYIPARIEHLLALATTYPDIEQQFEVVCLGSTAAVNGHLSVPCLWEEDGERVLFLDWYESNWFEEDRFLALRQPDSPATWAPSNIVAS